MKKPLILIPCLVFVTRGVGMPSVSTHLLNEVKHLLVLREPLQAALHIIDF